MFAENFVDEKLSDENWGSVKSPSVDNGGVVVTVVIVVVASIALDDVSAGWLSAKICCPLMFRTFVANYFDSLVQQLGESS